MKKAIKEKEIKKEKENGVKLEEAFVLWIHESKGGNDYLSGNTPTTNEGVTLNLVGFFNTKKKNPKEPDIRVYSQDDNGETDKEVCSLWEYTSKSGSKYLSGKTDDDEGIVAFYNEIDENSKIPYIRAYYREN